MHQPVRLISWIMMLALLGGLCLVPISAWEGEMVPEAYEALFSAVEPAETGDMLLSGEESLGTVLQGCSILFLGDSLLTGYGLDDYRQSWCSLLGTQYGMVTTGNAVAGSTFGVSSNYGYFPGGCYQPYCQRTLPEGDFDVILVMGSGNDWYCEIPLGTSLTSRNTGTLMGAVNVVIDRLQEAYPNALLLFATSWNSTGQENGLGYTTGDYNNTVIKVCAKRGIPCFESCDPTLSGIDSASVPFRETYFLSTEDYWHLNAKGQKLFLPVMAQWLQDMLLEYYVVAGFYDVTVNDWYADAVAYAAAQGITNGTSETTFEPETVMQRAMLMTMLYRTAGCPDVSGLSHPFEDLDATAYYYDAVVWGYHAGLTTGIDENHFDPEGELTREQLATFLYRYAGAEGSGYTRGELQRFSDAQEIGDYAYDAFSWAVGCDILHGTGNGTLEPRRAATRAEMVQLLTNYFRSLS